MIRLRRAAIGAGTPIIVAAALVVAAMPSAAADDPERSRIASERAAIEARYAARQRECLSRFVVTSCVDDAKRDRRLGLDALRARELQLDEARRRERTAQRRAELAAKAAEDASREQQRAARAASAPGPAREPPRPLESRHEAPAASAARGSGRVLERAHPGRWDAGLGGGGPKESAAERSQREASKRASYEARQREAAQHRKEVLEKDAEREKKKPAAPPLPIPGAASMPR